MASPVPLPLDVIIDILILLPVKSLLRFRCASKSFRSIIDGQDFVKLHLNYSLETNSSLSLVTLPFFGRTRFYSLSSDLLVCGFKINLSDYFRRRHDVIGSCKGLLALKNYPKGIILLNPLTQEVRVLPRFYPDLSGHEPSLHGFGYDVGTDDYKLVRVIVFEKPEYHTEVTVYSLKVNLWKRIKYFPYSWVDNRYRGNGAFVNGALHWLANRNQDAKGNDLILAFDLKTDRFYQVPTPFADVGLRGVLSGLLVLNGCLSLLCQYQRQDWDLRVMEEYGVKDSWTTLFKYSYRDRAIPSACSRTWDSVIPLACSRTWDKVLLEMHGSKLCWYNIVRHKVESYQETKDNAFVFVETLVSPYAGNRSLKSRRRRRRKLTLI